MVALLPLVLFAGALIHAARIPLNSTQPHEDDQDDQDVTSKWSCDVRAWVRAPDLRPNFTTEADARLSMNGTDCVDVKSWSVGLRYKERQVLRLRAPDAVFPVRPEWNESFGNFWDDQRDDIFQIGYMYMEDPFSKVMDEYNIAVSRHDLWEVHGAEQVVFDVQHELLSVSDGEQLPFDAVKSFSVHVPNTNFPPTPTSPDFDRENQNDEMFAGEVAFEYYFNLTLHNGTKLEYLTSYTGFLPSGPVGLESQGGIKETVAVELMREETWDRFDKVSECQNKNSSAQFRLEIEMPEERNFVQGSSSLSSHGSTVYLSATLFRTGNGSEVPVNITLSPCSEPAFTWAQQFPQAIKSNLTVTEEMFSGSIGDFGSMRRVKSDEELQLESRRRNHWGFLYCPRRNRWSDPFGQEDDVVVQLDSHADVQRVKIPVKTPNHILSNFHGAFVDYVSILDVQLDTRFECESQVAGGPGGQDSNEIWQEWRAPPPLEYPQHYVIGNISINVVAPPPLASSALPTHYLSPDALAPVLSGLNETDITFPLVGALRNETLEESKRNRYARRWQHEGVDGRFDHAAKIWQRKEKLEQQQQAV